MDLMTVISELRKKQQKGEGQSTSTNMRFRCNICKDTSWVQTDSGMKRCECYKKDIIEKRWRKFGVNPKDIKKINDYEADSEGKQKAKNKAANYIINFDTIREQRNNSIAFLGQPGCVDKDTEYFNGTEWKKISEYTDGEKVLQFTKERKAELVLPLKYIKEKESGMYRIQSFANRINQFISPDHRVIYETSKGNLAEIYAEEMVKRHNESKYGFPGKILTTFDYSGKGINMTENEIRLQIAVIADGSFPKKQIKCAVNIKKQRKKERLEMLLEKCKIDYKKYNKKNGYSVYRFYAPKREKEFLDYWYDCTNEQMKIVCDEVINWDGSTDGIRRKFHTTSIKSANFIQFAYSSIGCRAVINKYNRVDELHKKTEFTVNISNSNKVSMCNSNKKIVSIEKKKPIDGYKYCFKVESGMLVLRRGGRIFVTGNSGKTHLALGIGKALFERKDHVSVTYMPYLEVMRELKSNVFDEIAYNKVQAKYIDAELLIIDDLFKDKVKKGRIVSELTEADMKHIYPIINQRYINHKPTIYSSECNGNMLIDLDEALAGRILESCKENLVIFKYCKENNYRLRGI